MRIYAQRRGQLAGQLVGDVAVVAWAVAWAVVGVLVDASVAALAGPARDTARTARDLAGQLGEAASSAGQVPGVGEQLRRPFDAASGSLGDLVATADAQAASIERLAAVLGWLVFLIPVATVLLVWLPRRVRFVRRARAAQRFIDAQPDLDLFALRAMANQPMHVLAGISDDPVRAWRQGDRRVIDALAEVELRQAGLLLPARRS
ncbi:hypothetical protein SAMN04488544_0911 [Microlunatus sagamiharensis]|uniref:Uncharacterized protein n=1 Tax=Microlunatus sagamiharensis TaxID=546874 RepID=A0A1H2LWD1_9ACTN|nr:hypothetical protein [Microlunatus sagamiharensis]SDU84911.1 hypothetical protein SAMN04488544_0911 [Microlunatus sagamiharensis]